MAKFKMSKRKRCEVCQHDAKEQNEDLEELDAPAHTQSQ